jgi:hypothetical protein
MPHTPGPLPGNRKAPPERVLFAMEQLAKSRPAEAMRAVMEQFKVGRSSAKRALAHARILLAEAEQEQAPTMRGVLIARIDRMIDRSEAAGDFKAAFHGIRELVSIYGLRQPEEVVVTVDQEQVEVMEEMSDQELEVLARLEERRAHGKTEH